MDCLHISQASVDAQNKRIIGKCINSTDFLPKAREAEEDCSMALHLEPKNVKALYRRGLARKVSFCEM